MAEQIDLDVYVVYDRNVNWPSIISLECQIRLLRCRVCPEKCPDNRQLCGLGHQRTIELQPKSFGTRPEDQFDNFEKRITHLWMNDLDECHGLAVDKDMGIMDEFLKQAIMAAEDKDPYFPKPHKSLASDQKLLGKFGTSYMAISAIIMDKCKILMDAPLRQAPEKILGT